MSGPVTGRPRHRLLLDIQGAQDVDDGERGIGRLVIEHARALCRVPGAVAGLLLNPSLPFPGHLPAELLEPPLLAWNSAAVVEAAVATGPVAYHVMSPFEMRAPSAMVLPQHCLRPDVPVVVTLYDLIPLSDPDRYLPGDLRARYLQRLRLVSDADLVLAISAHTRAEAIGRAGVDPDRCVVVGAGAAPQFRPAAAGDGHLARLARRLPAVTGRPVLCVSGADERKNTERLIAAWGRLPAEVRSGHQLVIACRVPAGLAAAWDHDGRTAGLRAGEMVVTGEVADDTLVALYQSAALVVVPSLLEGFGLPVIEAAACDAPVITSDRTALPEVLDVPESTFDPLDVGAIAAAVERALTVPAHRATLLAAARTAARRHTFAAVADRTLAALDHLPRRAPSGGPRRQSRRRRIALVGALPPARSGVADFTARLVPELAELCDLDLLSPPIPGQPLTREGFGDARRFHIGALGRALNPLGYDAIVYALGNSEHHLATRDAALRWPGWLHLHDVRLGNLVRTGDGGAEAVADAVARQHWPRVPGERPDFDDLEVHRRFGFGLSAELVRRARGVIVNSALAERLLRLDQGPDGPLPPVVRGFLPGWASPVLDRRERSLRPPLVGMFGLVDPVKAPERAVDALPRIHAATGAELLVVGPSAPELRASLEARAAALGVGHALRFAGDVPPDEYRRLLRQVSVAVQLRLTTNGETSGALIDCLSCGVPVVTTIIDAAEQHRDAVVALAVDAGAEVIASAVVALLADPSALEAASRRAHAHALTRTNRVLAELILAAVDERRPVASGARVAAGAP